MKSITYWKDFYSTNKINLECSEFCNFIMNYLKNNNINIINVLDCGCGNGRDSYTLSTVYNVDAVDNSGFLPENRNNVFFFVDNFITIYKTKYDLIYSRFTFHSITNNEHNFFLDTISINSYLVIETRSKTSENEHVFFGKTHYRNCTDIDYLKTILTKKKFEIIYIEENRNFAIYKDEDPICIRVISIKR